MKPEQVRKQLSIFLLKVLLPLTVPVRNSNIYTGGEEDEKEEKLIKRGRIIINSDVGSVEAELGGFRVSCTMLKAS